MERIKVTVGSVTTGSDGITRDTTYEEEFVGEKVTVGITRDSHAPFVLYQAEDGRFLIHTEERQAETAITYSLHEVTPSDLSSTGRFAELGRSLTFTPIRGKTTVTVSPPYEMIRCQNCGKELGPRSQVFAESQFKGVPRRVPHGRGYVYLCADCAESDA